MLQSLKKEAIKSSGAIYVTGKATLRQRQLNNILLAHAFDNLKTQPYHTIKLKTISRYTSEYYEQNYSDLKNDLRALGTFQVEWDLIDKHGVEEEWGYTSMISGVKIKNGECVYAYSPMILDKISDPRFYIKINLKLQNIFSSKYGLILYEICLDCFISSRKYGFTPWFPVDIYRKIMGVEEGEYPLFKDFRKWVINPAVKEINERSDLEIEPEFQRDNRKIVAIRFQIKPNKNKENNVALETLERFERMQNKTEKTESIETSVQVIKEANFELSEQLKSLGISHDIRAKIFREYPPDKVKEKLDLISKIKGLTNPAGFLLKALKEDFQDTFKESGWGNSKGRTAEDFVKEIYVLNYANKGIYASEFQNNEEFFKAVRQLKQDGRCRVTLMKDEDEELYEDMLRENKSITDFM